MTTKTQISFAGQQVSMTHKEIADLVGSRVDNVKRTIERLSDSGIIRRPPLEDFEEFNNLGLTVKREYYCFEGEQGERDSIVVVAQLSPEFTAQLVDYWRELKKENARLKNNAMPPQPLPTANHNILSLARVVAEATASATMKAVMEVTNINLLTAAPASPTEQPTPIGAGADFVNTDSEFTPVHKVSWETGLSDPSCRRLVQFANLPSRQLPGVRGLCVHRESFLHAFQVLLEESTSPSGKRKRWQHPEFGGFILRKDSKEIPGESD